MIPTVIIMITMNISVFTRETDANFYRPISFGVHPPLSGSHITTNTNASTWDWWEKVKLKKRYFTKYK